MEYEIIIRIKQDFPSMQDVLDAMASVNEYFEDKYTHYSVAVDITHIRGVKEDG